MLLLSFILSHALNVCNLVGFALWDNMKNFISSKRVKTSPMFPLCGVF